MGKGVAGNNPPVSRERALQVSRHGRGERATYPDQKPEDTPVSDFDPRHRFVTDFFGRH